MQTMKYQATNRLKRICLSLALAFVFWALLVTAGG